MIEKVSNGKNNTQETKEAFIMSLFLCPECNHNVSDKAFSCPGCGYPISPIIPTHIPADAIPAHIPISSFHTPIQVPVSKKRSRKKLPNGYGTIKKLSGNRTRPYAAYPPAAAVRIGPSDTRIPAIGYFTDWYSAFDALSRYHSNPYDIGSRALTFAKVYELFYKDKFSSDKKNLSESSKYAYDTAFKNCTPLHNMKFFDLRKQDMQDVLDQCSLGYSSLCNLKKLFCQMYRYAMENDIVEKNYAQFVSIQQEDDTEKGEPFSEEELTILWKNKKDPTVQMILLLIYTGFRIKAFETMEINLEEGYFKGGVKTAAGKGRIVPIHRAILPFAKKFRKNFPNYRSRTFRSCNFYPTLERLGIATTHNGKKHTPHDCRHTFSWLCDKFQVDELSKHLLMGHSLGKDVEKAVYGHRTFEQLNAEIQKIHARYCR